MFLLVTMSTCIKHDGLCPYFKQTAVYMLNVSGYFAIVMFALIASPFFTCLTLSQCLKEGVLLLLTRNVGFSVGHACLPQASKLLAIAGLCTTHP